MCAIIRAIASPTSGLADWSAKRPSWKFSSRMMAWRPTAEKAMFCAVRRPDAAITAALSSSAGYSSAHCRACMPPSEPPTTACSRLMPRCATSARCTVTKSATSSSGKSSPQGLPVAGLIELGPVVPWQPPSRFAVITNQRSVSIALPGPIMVSHQPGRRSPSCQPAECASPVRAWQMKTALDAVAFSVP